MVDAEDVMLIEDRVQDLVQFPCRRAASSERLFDNDAGSLRATRILQLLDNESEQIRRYREIMRGVARIAELRAQDMEGFRICVIAVHVAQQQTKLLKCIVIEAARSAGLAEANSAEFDPETPDPVISTMADQVDIVAGEADLGGTMRLGAYPAVLEPESIVAQAYGATEVSERHRHRYEVNNAYRDKIAESGLRFSGTSPDGHLVEFVEYPPDVHPFIVGTQAHPELKSRPTRPHPLFVAFVGAAIDYKAGELLPVEIPEQSSNGIQHRDSAARPIPEPAARG